MELLQLKYFMTVAQMGHLTRAAESLYISQPTLSRSIRRLEDELGIKVFTKKGRGIVLTEFGEHFYIHVKHIFAELEQVDSERNDIVGRTDTPIRLGTTIPGIALPVLETYHSLEPETDFVHESIRDNKDLLAMISEGTLDLGFCDSVLFPSDLEHTPIWDDQLYAIVPAQHALASAEILTLEELTLYPLILSNSEASLWDMILAFNHGVEPNRYMHTTNILEALRLCMLGMGVTVTSGLHLDIQLQESSHNGKSLLDFAVPIPLEHCQWNISLVWKKQSYYRIQLRQFLAHVVSYYQTRSSRSILQSIVHKEKTDLDPILLTKPDHASAV